MEKNEPWQFETTIGGIRYVGLAWHTDERWVKAIAALFNLRYEHLYPKLRVRKIPATASREQKFLIFIPDLLDIRADFTKEEREMYTYLARRIPKFMEGHRG